MSSGYDPKRDGSFGGWFAGNFILGLLIALGFCIFLVHLANVKVAEKRAQDEKAQTAQEAGGELTTP